MSNQIGSRTDPDNEPLAGRLAQIEQRLADLLGRLDRLEQNVAALGERMSESRERLEADTRRMESQLAEHAAILESSRTAVAQTDDLVERVVEALESLQTSVRDLPDTGSVGVN